MNTSGGSTPFRQRRAHRTRGRILDASLRLFSDRGYDGASMEDIALELEATKGSSTTTSAPSRRS
jgi:AcrR family transcriptional regulator